MNKEALEGLHPSAGDDEMDKADNTPQMSLGDHLEELRRRLFYSVIGLVVAMVITLIFGTQLMQWIEYPYMAAIESLNKAHNLQLKPQLTVLEIGGAFAMYMRVCLYAAIVLAAPWMVYQLWMFVGAGLLPHERRWIGMIIPFSVFLFLCGAAFGTYLSIPTIKFFVLFGIEDLQVQQMVALDKYIGFMTDLLLVFGLAFQVPLVVLGLAKVGIVEMDTLRKYRRHVVVAMFAVAAVFAPGDPVVSMVVMAVSMWGLYELGLGLAWFFVYRKQ